MDQDENPIPSQMQRKPMNVCCRVKNKLASYQLLNGSLLNLTKKKIVNDHGR